MASFFLWATSASVITNIDLPGWYSFYLLLFLPWRRLPLLIIETHVAVQAPFGIKQLIAGCTAKAVPFLTPVSRICLRLTTVGNNRRKQDEKSSIRKLECLCYDLYSNLMTTLTMFLYFRDPLKPAFVGWGGGNASMDHLPLNPELGKESHWDIIDKQGLPKRW